MSSDILSIHGEYILRGHRRTTVQVHRAGVVRIRGTLEGCLLIEPGGAAHVFGPVWGDIHNAGRLILAGHVRGSGQTTDGGRLLDFRHPPT
jgi:hypothetical protein